MNKNNIKLISIGIIITGVLFTGCNSGQTKKADAVNKNQTEKSKTFKVDVVGKTGELPRDWLDINHVLEMGLDNHKPISREYNNFDNTVQLSDSKYISDVSISPDKNKLCFDKWGGEEEDEIKDLKSGNEKKINLSTPAWSPNSRYYCGRLSGSKEKITFLIYNTENNTEMKIETISRNDGAYIWGIIVSNDCKHALIMSEHHPLREKPKTDLYYVDIIDNKLSFTNTAELEKYKVGSVIRYSFLDDSTILFTDTMDNSIVPAYSLYSYDINSKSSKKLLDNIYNFDISPNEKYIAFINNAGDGLQIGKFNKQTMSISNTQNVYKDKGLGIIKWSPDNKKMLCNNVILELQE